MLSLSSVLPFIAGSAALAVMLLLIWLLMLLLLLLIVVVVGVVVASPGLLSTFTGSADRMAVPQTHRASFFLLLPLFLVTVASKIDCTFLLS